MSTRVCSWCNNTVEAEVWCHFCEETFDSRPDTETMTPEERQAEFDALGHKLEIPFPRVHKRLEQLVGRPVWTHEFALNWDGLREEVRWEKRPATMEEIISLIPEEKRVLITPIGETNEP